MALRACTFLAIDTQHSLTRESSCCLSSFPNSSASRASTGSFNITCSTANAFRSATVSSPASTEAASSLRSLTSTSVPVQKAPLLRPTPTTSAPCQVKREPASQEKKSGGGDWNSFMLFNRGFETVKSVDKESFWPTLEAAGDKLVVLDLYSKWCGPCRMIYPKLVKLSGQYDDVVFLKLDCTNDNKFLFSKMGVGILPTFKIFKNNSLITEVKGAKYDELVRQIEKARVPDSMQGLKLQSSCS